MGGNSMNNDTSKKWLLVGVAAAGVVAGVVGGYFAAHVGMSDMPGMTTGKGDVKGMDMKAMQGMEGMKGMQPGAVVIPAVTRQLIGVRSAPVTYAPLAQEVRAVGTVEYDERKLTKVNLRVSGWIEQVFVNAIGQSVRAGQPLLTLYSPDLLATQDEYLLAVKAQAQLEGSPVAEARQQAAALVSSARERLRLWNLTDEQIAVIERRGKAERVLAVYAPSSGIVLKRQALPGNYVEPGTTLYELADLSTVWINGDIYESEIPSVKLNQPAKVTFEAYPSETFRGKVAYIYPYLNEATRTVRVRMEFPNPHLKLKPGMYGNVVLGVDAGRRLVVPKEAVLDSGLRQLVFLDLGQGVYQPYPVKLGRRSQEYVEVLEGVKEGDRVVTSANFLLDAESKLASAGGMQAMMGQIGMADWQMRGAHEAKMEGMPGMKSEPGKPVSETRQVSGFSLTLSTVPDKPKAGENVLRLKLADQAGKPVTNAQVVFAYTMPMPGMMESKAKATHTKDGIYEAKALLGMGGTWVVTANVTLPNFPPISEKFQITVGGGGM
ncbi:MAG: efflux RND transporter periplasmic adaptor subunit [Nitrospirae bacterium]|nr:MAG: efflux RND transporter periplasmic adaptor subunit [Nitrospirota bacterium]